MSKMKMAGKTPLCVECNKFYSLKKMNEAQTELAHETGICPICQSKEEILDKYLPKFDVVKPASRIRMAFMEVAEKLELQDINNLQNKDFCLKMFGLNYAFLKPIIILDNLSVKQQLMVNGKARYGAKINLIQGNMYVITNDLYQQNVDRFIKWVQTK